MGRVHVCAFTPSTTTHTVSRFLSHTLNPPTHALTHWSEQKTLSIQVKPKAAKRKVESHSAHAQLYMSAFIGQTIKYCKKKQNPRNKIVKKDEASVRARSSFSLSGHIHILGLCLFLFLKISTEWKFTESAARLSLRFAFSLTSSVTSLHWFRVPLKCVDEVNKFRSPQKRKTKRGCSSGQTGTIVSCMCCIWDSTSCCTLAIIMSWCDGVIIPSLSISLWVHKWVHGQNKINKQLIWKRKSSWLSVCWPEVSDSPGRSGNSPLIVCSRELPKHHVSN